MNRPRLRLYLWTCIALSIVSWLAEAVWLLYVWSSQPSLARPAPNPAFERTAASALRLLAVPSSLRSSAAAQRER
jgi:hypothetical protein